MRRTMLCALGALLGALLGACERDRGGDETDAGPDDGDAGTIVPCDDDNRDHDGDGFAGCMDCDDRDPDVNAAVNEGFCCSTNLDDGIDNDCDGEIDETPLLQGCSCWQDDPDADGYLDRYDCAPDDATVNPGITEGQWCSPDRFDGKDNDCDGEVDELETDRPCDADYDGVPEDDDCDDRNSFVSPMFTESCCQCPSGNGYFRAAQCDGLDNDCDGEIDESPVCDCAQPDLDGDGFLDGDDCDDSNYQMAPGYPECCCPESAPWSCDQIDNDCDGEVDENFGSCCTNYYGGEG